jgi:hypothetical protein
MKLSLGDATISQEEAARNTYIASFLLTHTI